MTATLGAYPAVSRPRCGTGPTDFEALEQWHHNISSSEVKDLPQDTNTNPIMFDSSTSTVQNVPKDITGSTGSIDSSGAAYDFETIHGLDIYGCELAPTVRDGMRAWNMTVQYWLATYVYKRLTLKSGPLRVAITMTVSAFWHGVHPGYYLSFLTIPPNLIAEEVMAAAFRGPRDATVADNDGRKQLSSSMRAVLFDWCCWFFKMRSFEYMSMSFMLLGFTATLRYWYSIYFIGHLYVLLFIIIGRACRPRRARSERKIVTDAE
jgi:lysophospholipid acyltransferase 7